ncbi:hypothetical protein PROVRUST_07230 [Providencia rustigianii DSM 4541]|uniref:Uncharacterized protein n=1 Tax=Providencia rustigianii DSM 4541 TaxID=500637 RepID=D1P4S8_9GAMM|nr:hypothetical protein PROVRUST_07230 [Providencia rustigianii DSM 4541]
MISFFYCFLNYMQFIVLVIILIELYLLSETYCDANFIYRFVS